MTIQRSLITMPTHEDPRLSPIPLTIIVMGVSGSGKTEVGKRVAAKLGAIFEDGDDFHTEEAKEKMRAGIPLTDEDRFPWFMRMRRRIEEVRQTGTRYVLACSALKSKYREWLREGDAPDVLQFVFLDGDFDLIHGRMAQRKGHYMPVSLLESQFAALEKPVTEAITVPIDGTLDEITATVLERLSARQQ